MILRKGIEYQVETMGLLMHCYNYACSTIYPRASTRECTREQASHTLTSKPRVNKQANVNKQATRKQASHT